MFTNRQQELLNQPFVQKDEHNGIVCIMFNGLYGDCYYLRIEASVIKTWRQTHYDSILNVTLGTFFRQLKNMGEINV